MLNPLRNQIDQIDKKLTALLLERYNVVKEIANVKYKNNLPIEDKEREESSIENLISNLDPTDSQKEYIKDILSAIHKTSKDVQ